MIKSRLILSFLLFILSSSCAQEKNETYFPEQYEEFKTDTVLDSKANVRVIIVRKTLMDKAVAFTYTDDKNQNYTHFYRDYATEITVIRSDKILFKKTLYKTNFEQIGDEEFLKKAITHNTWIQGYDKKSGTVRISHVIGVPETDWAYHFTLVIDKNGSFHSELDEIE